MRNEKDILIFKAFSKFSYIQFIEAQQRNAKSIVEELKTFDSDRDYDPAGVKEMEKSLEDLLSFTKQRQDFISYSNVHENVTESDI